MPSIGGMILFFILLSLGFFGRHDLAPGAVFAIAPLVAATALGAAGSIASSLFGKKVSATQVPLETPEQAAARRALLNIGTTGEYNGTTLGAGYTGPLGDFTKSPIETAAQGRLSALLSGGKPAIYGAGVNELMDLLGPNSSFDPNNPKGEYAAFANQNAYNLKNAVRDTKRSLAYSGDLYSSDAGRQITDLNTQSDLGLQSKLAELSDKYAQRKLDAVPLALSAATTGQSLDTNAINEGFQYGGLDRTLNTAEDQSNLAEWIRARQEKLGGINALASVAGGNTPFGVPSASATLPNPLQGTFNNLTSAGISALMQQYLLNGSSTQAPAAPNIGPW